MEKIEIVAPGAQHNDLMIKCLIIIILSGHFAFAATWRPSDLFLNAVRHVESSHGRFVYGDNGDSLGDFQLSEAAWTDVNAWRKARNEPQYSYKKHVLNRRINRLYAADYFTILYNSLQRNVKRTPTHGELYAAYNMGMTQFARCRFSLSRVNSVTRSKCELIEAIVQGRVAR